MHRRTLIAFGGTAALVPAWMPVLAHHGWSSFDTERPIYLEGVARKVVWRNPHAELDLQLPAAGLKLPADLAQRAFPAQSAQVDGKRLLGAAQLPTRKDAVWRIELAPLTRLQAWGAAEIKDGDPISVLGFTFAQEKGDAILRAEYLFAGGKAYGLRSSPA
ncbi:MAG: hypothetical protein AD742_12630 [Methylibium sp. NZG]|nr:MAG: hypothetical protein AD742_12630 [Methylibium sp. NZG]